MTIDTDTSHKVILSIPLSSERDCFPLALSLGQILKPGHLVALVGDLGTGKTVFARSLLRAFYESPDLEVPSPTFTLVQSYQAPGKMPILHADLYRLSPSDDISDLMIEDALEQGAVIVEWPDRLTADLLEDALLLRFDVKADNRTVEILAKDRWQSRLSGLAESLKKASLRPDMKAKAMILAAGKGTRLGALGKSLPKPLVQVLGKPLIDYAIDHLAAARMLPVVVNTHHLADQLVTHLGPYIDDHSVLISHEETLLETGGGVKKALPMLASSSFTVINADVIWRNAGTPLLQRLTQAFDPSRMDMLLALVPMDQTTGWRPDGDIRLLGEPDGDGLAPCALRDSATAAPFAYSGTMQISATAYSDTPDGPFSNLDLFKRAEANGRLFGLVHTGSAHHVGTPEGIALAENAMEQSI